MGDTLVLKKFQQLAPAEQLMVGEFIDFLLAKNTTQPQEKNPDKRTLGTLKGKIKMAADFNEPLEELKEYMQ